MIVCDHSSNRYPSPRFPRRSPLKFRLATVAVAVAATAVAAVAVQIDWRRRDDVAASSLKRDVPADRPEAHVRKQDDAGERVRSFLQGSAAQHLRGEEEKMPRVLSPWHPHLGDGATAL